MDSETSAQEASPTVDRSQPWLVPVRMLNEFTYCPRLFYFEWVQGAFRDNADTVDGRHQHRRVDHASGDIGSPDEPADDRIHARSVAMDAPVVGLTTRIDLAEADDGSVTPVDYKRGSKPGIPEGAWEPERVQVCAQGLVLRENGFQSREGAIYFVASKERVRVTFDDALVGRTLDLLADLRRAAADPLPPPPLVDSPKCVRCSLAPICLPDETNLILRGGQEAPLRQLVPARDDALPLYIQEPGTRVSKDHGVLRIHTPEGDPVEVRLCETSSLSLFGAVQISAQAIGELCDRAIPICHFSGGGWFRGLTTGMPHNDVEVRRAQARRADDPRFCLELARGFVFGKVRNCRTMVRRNHESPPPAALKELARLARGARRAETMESLLGVEGAAARLYFSLVQGLLRPRVPWTGLGIDFDGRNRRPPRDPVNALLSLSYAVLAKTFAITTFAVGLDPMLGFYHQPRFGRPSLALDLMEEFRPLIADSAVISAINTGVVGPDDFLGRAGACALTPAGRRRFLNAVEGRLDQEITHPSFGYRISYRRVLEVQARLLARRLTGEIPRFPPFLTR
ncbi:MAG: CRISPR-associated endonuclease Cas1 [Acidobacteriota bacterium]